MAALTISNSTNWHNVPRELFEVDHRYVLLCMAMAFREPKECGNSNWSPIWLIDWCPLTAISIFIFVISSWIYLLTSTWPHEPWTWISQPIAKCMGIKCADIFTISATAKNARQAGHWSNNQYVSTAKGIILFTIFFFSLTFSINDCYNLLATWYILALMYSTPNKYVREDKRFAWLVIISEPFRWKLIIDNGNEAWAAHELWQFLADN